MSTERSEHLLGFGQALGRERERQGLSIEEVNRKTKIAVRMLRALEQEDFDTLPAAVYVRGFIKAYASALALDAAELLGQFEAALKVCRPVRPSLLPKPAASQTEGPETESGPAPMVTPESAAAAWLAAARRKGKLPAEGPELAENGPARERAGALGRGPRKVSLAVVLILLFVALTLVVSYMLNRSTSSDSQSKKPAANETVNFDLTG